MLHRAYYKKCHDRQPTYAVVTVCEGWLYFMNFRSWWIDSFVNDHGDTVGGARFHKCTGKYQARCSHPITKEREYLGLYETISCANSAWLRRKLEIAKELKSEMDLVDARLYERVVSYVMNRAHWE